LAKIADGLGVPIAELLGEPVPLGEAPEEAGRPELSEGELRYLVLLVQSHRLYMQDLGNRNARRIFNLSEEPRYEEALRANLWLEEFLSCCRCVSWVLNLTHVAAAIEPWVARVDADDASVPEVLREQAYRFQRVRDWLFTEVEPRAREWQKRQRERFPNDAEIWQIGVDVEQQLAAEQEAQTSEATRSRNG
jgi:hypothetical protein